MKAFEANIRKVVPYVPGEQPKRSYMIKLNTNENPYPPAPGVAKALQEMGGERMRLYPDPTSQVLVDALADYYHVGKDQVFVGVGSDDVLAMAFMTFFNSKKPILFPDVTYSFYPVWADLLNIPYERPALDENFRIRREDYYRENGGIVLPNPNAPTAIAEPLQFIEDILIHNPDVIVVIDEAYVDFGAQSALPLLEKYENLLIVQTFSKSRSMAGMRIGFAIGSPLLIKYMNDVKYSYNSYTMNTPSLLCGVEAVKDEAYFRKTVNDIIETRTYAVHRFKELGFEMTDSSANFLFITHPKYKAKDLFEALKKENIFVRYFAADRVDNYLRVTIGTREEMKELFEFLEGYVKEN